MKRSLTQYRLFEQGTPDAKGAKVYWFLYTDGEGRPKTYLGKTSKPFFRRIEQHEDPQISDKKNLSYHGYCLVGSTKIATALERVIGKRLEMKFINGNPGGRVLGDVIGEIILNIHLCFQTLRDYYLDIVDVSIDGRITVDFNAWYHLAFGDD